MKVGSTVCFVGVPHYPPFEMAQPSREEYYTVRDLHRAYGLIKLEEIVNPICNYPGLARMEPWYNIEDWREVNLTSLTESIREALEKVIEQPILQP